MLLPPHINKRETENNGRMTPTLLLWFLLFSTFSVFTFLAFHFNSLLLIEYHICLNILLIYVSVKLKIGSQTGSRFV